MTAPKVVKLVELILSVDELLEPEPEGGASCVEVPPEDWADMVRLALELRAEPTPKKGAKR